MIRNALAAALVIYVLLVGIVLKECVFLAPLRNEIWQQYGESFLLFSLTLILNLYAAIYAVLRRVALNDTGEKLSHLEKQLRGRATISSELSDRILERK